MTTITIDSLIENGFEHKKFLKQMIFTKNIIEKSNIKIEIIFFDYVIEDIILTSNDNFSFGGIQINNFKYIEQIDNLIDALNGKIK